MLQNYRVHLSESFDAWGARVPVTDVHTQLGRTSDQCLLKPVCFGLIHGGRGNFSLWRLRSDFPLSFLDSVGGVVTGGKSVSAKWLSVEKSASLINKYLLDVYQSAAISRKYLVFGECVSTAFC